MYEIVSINFLKSLCGVCVCVFLSICALCVYGDQKTVSDSLELELEVISDTGAGN